MLKNLKKRLKDQRGLTLVELLAVIVILGIIAAIAVPSIGNIIAKSKYDAAKADAIQVLNAAKMYAATNGVPTSDLTETSTELQEFISEIENLKTYKISFPSEKNGTPIIDAIAKDGIVAKGQNTVATFKGTVSEVSKYEYKTGNKGE